MENLPFNARPTALSNSGFESQALESCPEIQTVSLIEQCAPGAGRTISSDEDHKKEQDAQGTGFFTASGNSPTSKPDTGTDPKPSLPQTEPFLLTVGVVAAMLDVSERTIYRFADSGRIPRPIKLGSLVRWRRAEIEQWIADGCPNLRRGKAGA